MPYNGFIMSWKSVKGTLISTNCPFENKNCPREIWENSLGDVRNYLGRRDKSRLYMGNIGKIDINDAIVITNPFANRIRTDFGNFFQVGADFL